MPAILRLSAFALLVFASQALAQATRASGVADDASAQGASERSRPARNAAFYTAQVTLASQSAGERRGATVRALGQVITRLTGDMNAPSNPVIRRATSNMDALVSDSRLSQDSEVVNGVPVYKTVLSVSFDPDSVDALIAGAGLKFWSSNRPKPILWLAIDDGRGPRLVTGQQTTVVRPLALRGLERGMRFLLPAGNTAEQAAVGSIWALNAPAMQVLTNRYRNDAQLIGKVYRKALGWAADWVFTQDGVELARWSFSDANPRRVIASGVDTGANALAKRDAVGLDTGVAGVHTVLVEGIQNQADFIRLMSYLQNLAVVRKVTAVEANPQELRLQLDLSVGMKGFRNMLSTGDTLVAGPETMPGVSRFFLQ